MNLRLAPQLYAVCKMDAGQCIPSWANGEVIAWLSWTHICHLKQSSNMCGRFTLKTPSETIADLFSSLPKLELTPRYNIAPTQEVVTVWQKARQPEQANLKWGLIPFWSDDPKIGNRMINARAETVAEKPAFRAAFKKRRCLIAADGFYEWKTVNSKKQPLHIHLKDFRPFFFAGLWEKIPSALTSPSNHAPSSRPRPIRSWNRFTIVCP